MLVKLIELYIIPDSGKILSLISPQFVPYEPFFYRKIGPIIL